ncbi:MAG: hydroxymethylglutaryl-CoA reductase [Chitinispirillaceae bacterium]|nr:hydroxymethylglutaryl-CoA reductase [Chitinispirillaceae bacterium]
MASPYDRVKNYLADIYSRASREELIARLTPKNNPPLSRIPRGVSQEHMARRLDLLALSEEDRSLIADPHSVEHHDDYVKNIENYIGTLRVPLGIAGPLRVNGLFAQGDYYVPLATTEAALVASYNRGARLVTAAGGCTTMLLNEGVGRAPGFVFNNLVEAGLFVTWANEQFDAFRQVAGTTTRHGALVNMKITIEGNHVYIYFEFTTADASGQNMVTIATEAICSYIRKKSPVKPQHYFVEANLSGDKKASFQSFVSVRGKKVAAEIALPADLVKQYLRTTPDAMVKYWQVSAIGGSLSGTLGMQGHYANGLTGLYLACGQDAACVAESAIGLTRLETTDTGGLYTSVNLPNLMVGTVGGGTGLPVQRACLRILGLAGPDNARAFAEVAAGLCLAGELSIMGALCAGDFSKAHQVLARGKDKVS